jgi:uncharacterized protein DUF6174
MASNAATPSLIVALFAATITACGSALSPIAELSDARRRWADNGPASYSIDLFRSCECTPEMSGPVVVNVQNGTVQSRFYRAGGTVPPNLAAAFPGVEGLFDLIADARQRNAHRLEVRYDRDLGYPVWLVIDYDRAIADDEFTYSVMAFVRR